MKNANHQGFTLIELLIVIAIIAILASIAIPQYALYRQKAARASMITDARNAGVHLEAVYIDCQAYATIGATVGPNSLPVVAPAGCTALMPNVVVTLGNTLTITTPAAGTWNVTVANANAGPGISPLVMAGGANAAFVCNFANGTSCQ